VIVTFQRLTFLYDVSKILIDNAPLGFGMFLRPRRCSDPPDAIEPIIVLRSKNPFVNNEALFLS
jgi:hypothetical protein